MKKIVAIAFILSFFFSAGVAFAQDTQNFVTVEPLTNLPGLEEATSGGVGTLINEIYKYGIGLGAILAVLVLMYGGFQYMTSEAAGSKGAAKETIQRAILGLVLLLSPVLVFGIINQDIGNFNLQLSKLNSGVGTTTTPGGPGGGSGSCSTITFTDDDQNIFTPNKSDNVPEDMTRPAFNRCCSLNSCLPETGQVADGASTYTQYSCDCEKVKMFVNKVHVEYSDGRVLENIVERGPTGVPTEKSFALVSGGDAIKPALCDRIKTRVASNWAEQTVNSLFQSGDLNWRSASGLNFVEPPDSEDVQKIILDPAFLNPNDVTCDRDE